MSIEAYGPAGRWHRGSMVLAASAAAFVGIAAGVGSADLPASAAMGPAPTAYIAGQGNNSVIPLRTNSNELEPRIDVGGAPRAMAITPNGTTAYVISPTTDFVTPINTATNVAGTPINVNSEQRGIAIAPNGVTAYAATLGSITPINTATNVAGTPIPVTGANGVIAITPNGATAYVADFPGGTVTPVNLTAKSGAPLFQSACHRRSPSLPTAPRRM